MILRDMVPRKLKLGDRVYYTHRASTSDGRDMPNGRFPFSMFDYTAPKPPVHFGRSGVNARWVIVWPEDGYGTIVGLTSRCEGIIEPAYEGEQATFSENERYPLYEVKTTLRGRPLLIPPWACFPLSWIDGPVDLTGLDEDAPVPMDGGEFSEYVDVFLRTAPEKVTSRG